MALQIASNAKHPDKLFNKLRSAYYEITGPPMAEPLDREGLSRMKRFMKKHSKQIKVNE